MNRYDHHFRALPALVRVNAAQKVGFARSGLIQHRGNGFGPEDDDAIMRQFDLDGMAEFWDVVLSEPMECGDFAHALSVHFMIIEHKPSGTDAERLASGPAASRAVDTVKMQLRSALRQARLDGEPWFIDLPSQDKPLDPAPAYREVLIYSAVIGPPKKDYALVVPPDPPADGVDLTRLKVRPRPAVEWLLAMPMRRHLVPPSLAAALSPEAPKTAQPKRGRPEGTSFAKADQVLAESMNTMVATGEAASPTAAAWVLIGRDGSGANGNGTPDAKVKRLVRAAKALRETQDNAD